MTMNNSQFRNLVGEQKTTSSSPSQNGFKKPMLGSRARASIPMTPRSLGTHNQSKDFARQVAEFKGESSDEPPTKKFKSITAPRGTKFSSGYVDRSLERREKDADSVLDEDLADKIKRLKALEEMLKLQQIDQATFDKLRVELGVGGDTLSTHMVKGLDWKLLERVRRGEDINKSEEKKSEEPVDEPNMDEELEKALEKEVVPVTKSQRSDQVEELTSETSSLPTSRDEILRRFRQSRLNPTNSEMPPEPAAPVLSNKFKKMESFPQPGKKKYVEFVNGRKREVLLITGKDGKTKRKTRWLDAEESTFSPEQQQAWGGDVSTEIAARQKTFEEEQKRREAEEEEQADGNIFADVGDYDPLAGLESDESEEIDEEPERKTHSERGEAEGDELVKSSPAILESKAQVSSRNYFSTSKDQTVAQETADAKGSINQDPTIISALKRAAQLRQADSTSENDTAQGEKTSDPEQESKRRAFLAKLKEQDRQDALDLDMGFGGSRLGDGNDDDEDGDVVLADWNDGEEGADEKPVKGNAGRKRGAKKRKGNKNNVQDVMSVLEGRQKK